MGHEGLIEPPVAAEQAVGVGVILVGAGVGDGLKGFFDAVLQTGELRLQSGMETDCGVAVERIVGPCPKRCRITPNRSNRSWA